MADFNFDELNKLAADLGNIAGNIEKPLKQALSFTAFGVKKAAQARVGSRKHFKQAARAITFDVTGQVPEFTAEIGYDKDRGGAALLGNIVEFGAPGSANSIAPGNELATALHDNEADFEKGVGLAAEAALRGGGF